MFSKLGISVFALLGSSLLCKAETSTVSDFINQNSETASSILDVCAELAKGIGAPWGYVISAVLTVASVGFAAIAKKQHSEKISIEEKKELVRKALRSTIEGIEAYKNEVRKDDTCGHEAERVNAILSKYHNKAGDTVHKEVDDIRGEVKSEQK